MTKEISADDYLKSLNSLNTPKSHRWLTNPTINDLSRLCPHLGEKQLAELLDAKPKTLNFIALPPTTVRGAFLIAEYRVFGDHAKPDFIITGAGKLKSALPQHVKKDLIDRPIYAKYYQEAIDYAEKHWPERLIDDTWAEVGRTFIYDTSKLEKVTDWEYGTEGLIPKLQCVVQWCIDRPWKEIVYHGSHTKLLNDAIMLLHILRKEPYATDEIEAGRPHDGKLSMAIPSLDGSYVSYISEYGYHNCGNCGGSITSTHCSICNKIFKKLSPHFDLKTPLPPKIVDFLKENGHKFKIDPSLA